MSTQIERLSPRDGARVGTLQIIVKDETPFLPKVGFTLITLASLGGAVFTGLGLGIEGPALLVRWLTLWSIALAGGFLAWRLIYLRRSERDVDQGPVDALNVTALARADQVARRVAPIVALALPAPLSSRSSAANHCCEPASSPGPSSSPRCSHSE